MEKKERNDSKNSRAPFPNPSLLVSLSDPMLGSFGGDGALSDVESSDAIIIFFFGKEQYLAILPLKKEIGEFGWFDL